MAAVTLNCDQGCPWLARYLHLLSLFSDCFSPRCLRAWLLPRIQMPGLLGSRLPDPVGGNRSPSPTTLPRSHFSHVPFCWQ